MFKPNKVYRNWKQQDVDLFVTGVLKRPTEDGAIELHCFWLTRTSRMILGRGDNDFIRIARNQIKDWKLLDGVQPNL